MLRNSLRSKEQNELDLFAKEDGVICGRLVSAGLARLTSSWRGGARGPVHHHDGDHPTRAGVGGGRGGHDLIMIMMTMTTMLIMMVEETWPPASLRSSLVVAPPPSRPSRLSASKSSGVRKLMRFH